ncbi:btb poz domain-containing [Trichoderma cornu-damae]|uniref:Btb poz domain-containing n=1 Tax=Trichoderma cornu-damae TaxID=654480 RepID=A0A9P8TUM3_9HYPO|nr:btb poz domain-containing [Trichoderma cornu-damae]
MTLDKALPPTPGPDTSGLSTILVGPKKRRFKVNCQLLCDISPFFQERLEDPFHSQTVSLWLPSESPAMFGLFVEWVHSPETFRDYLDDVISSAYKKGEQASLDIHWAIIHLHLFASQLSLSCLQDASIDAIQDLYLKYDWDVPPKLVVYLYTECEAGPSIRLRRWAVAMVAFCLAVGGQVKFAGQDSATTDPIQFHALFQSLSGFAADYAQHMENMKESGHDVRLKNPQLRISANELCSDGRLFGFRECSFHSHRAAVGEVEISA